MPRSIRLATSLAVVAVLAACPAPREVDPLTGRTYVLRGRGDVDVPVVTSEYQGDTIAVLADTVVFVAGSRVRHTRVWRAYGRSGPSVTTSSATLAYRAAGAQITLGARSQCGAAALCTPDLVGRIDDATLEVAEDVEPRPPAWRYRRMAGQR